MIELQGKYTTAKIMIDNVEEGVISQIMSMMNMESCANPIRIMPDTHVGNDVVIGFTEKCNGMISPNTIGVDIGCGMLAQKYNIDVVDADFSFGLLDGEIRKRIPLGFNIHSGKQFLPQEIMYYAEHDAVGLTDKLNNLNDSDYDVPEFNGDFFESLCKKIGASSTQVINSVGTLGGGNHFIELDKDESGNIWSVVHSGSRNFGLKIATYHQKKLGKNSLAVLKGEEAHEYFMDMLVAQQFADTNRRIISDQIADIIGCKIKTIVSSIHNYLNYEDMIIRKGAISSYTGELMVIPFNMKDGTIICEGKSNPDWNFSAPHGAGRVMSRSQAKKVLSYPKFEQQMNDAHIYSTSVSMNTLDEAPDCYKNCDMIMQAIAPTASIKHVLMPLYNLKG